MFKRRKINTIVPITIKMVDKIIAPVMKRKYFALLSGSLRYSFIGSLLTDNQLTEIMFNLDIC